MTYLRTLTLLALALGFLAGFSSPLAAQKKVDDAVDEAVRLLLGKQEAYVADPPVGRLPKRKLSAWQKKERARLRKAAAASENGAEWPYEGVYRIGRDRTIPPGYRVGGTAIVCSTLVAAPGWKKDKERQAAVERSIEFMLNELTTNEKLEASAQRGYDVRGWAHTYALDFFLTALDKNIGDKKTTARMKKMIPQLLGCLDKGEIRGGGWNYAGRGCSPFMTGSTLIALYRAKAAGYDFEAGLVDRALEALEKSRAEIGSYAYSGRERSRRPTAMPGACARAAVAELCLLLAGRSDAKKLRVAVDGFFKHWDELKKRKSKQGTHEGKYGVAPYYFFYGHTYAALAIEYLPKSDRAPLRKKMQKTLWKTREADGGWNDRIFPRTKSYSTAMAALALMAPDLDRIPEWASSKSDEVQ